MSDNQHWVQICIEVSSALEAELATFVLEQVALEDECVVVEQLGDAKDVSHLALLPEQVLKLAIHGDRDTEALRTHLYTQCESQGIPFPTYIPIEPTDWENAWKANYDTFKIGERFWIRPNWLPMPDTAENELVITLDPNMAFGTGTHETTQLCLEILETVIQEGDRVIDIGTGSGILAVGAVQLGASYVFAFDNDQIAVDSTHEHMAMNGVSESIEVELGVLADFPTKPWDVVIINIIAPVVLDLLQNGDVMSYAKDGREMIISGILAPQKQQVVDAIENAGGTIQAIHQKGEWLGFSILKTS